MKAMQKAQGAHPFHAVGRRKSSVARVWMKQGTGKVIVNDLDHVQYFDTDVARDSAVSPLKLTGLDKKFDIQVNVNGGGKIGQAEAIRLGVARALLESDASLREMLRGNGLLTVDARKKERKKYGQLGARRKFQFVKR